MLHTMTTQPLTRVLVFKTNIHTLSDKVCISTVLDPVPQIADWNVDLEDIDRVLRIVSDTVNTGEIIAMVGKAGYHCQELD